MIAASQLVFYIRSERRGRRTLESVNGMKKGRGRGQIRQKGKRT